MNWLDKLERKFGRYAIRNLPLYIVMLYAIGAVLNIMTKGSYYYYVALNPYMILHGQVWRLLGFLIVPPNANIIFIIFVLMFYYSIGESLVQVWGAFRFNMYIFLGVIATIAAYLSVYDDLYGYILFESVDVFSICNDFSGDAGIPLWNRAG